MEQVEATVRETIYRNAENGYSVGQVKAGQRLTTVVGVLPEMSSGEQVIFTGEWMEHPQYGRQLRCTSCQIQKPTSLLGIERYLGSGLIRGVGPSTAKQIVEVIKTAAPDMFTSNAAYEQVVAAQLIPQYAAELRAAIPDISETVLAGINFDFLGINLGAVPQFNVFSASWVWDWAHIGAFLIALTSAACQLLQMVISQKTNDSVITDEKGVQDKETAKNSQQNQSMKVMMWMMPLMSLWIGFTVSAGLSLYWFIGGVVRMISDPIMTNHYRKIYDAEDAVRLQKALEQERIEAEKERVRAERRASNPDGITANTSKKKLEKQQRDQEQAAKAAAAKEYAARKGIVEEATREENAPLSGVSDRPFCKGRNYDPDRYAPKSMEE